METMTCESFEVVDCGSRNKNIDSCSYRRSECPVAHCQPCFVGSCRGLTDGLHANDKRLWSPYYTNCYKERAIESRVCPPDSDGRTQFFHPCLEMCVPLYLIPREYEGTLPLCNVESDGVVWRRLPPMRRMQRGSIYLRRLGI